jgi:hypothetical protein
MHTVTLALYRLLPVLFLTVFVSCNTTPDDKAWKIADKADTREEVLRYLTDYPDGKHTAKAQQRLQDIDWAVANQQNTAYHWLAFVANYPDSPRKAEAQQRLQAMQPDSIPRSTLLSNRFTGLLQYKGATEKQLLSARFAEHTEPAALTLDVNLGNTRKQLVAYYNPDDNQLAIKENESDPVQLRLSQGKAYLRSGTLFIESTDPAVYWKLTAQ